MKKFVVASYDAYDSPDERRNIEHGEFDTEEEAVQFAKNMIDNFLLKQIELNKEPDKLYDLFCRIGDIPMIWGESKSDFHPFRYAQSKVKELQITFFKVL